MNCGPEQRLALGADTAAGNLWLHIRRLSRVLAQHKSRCELHLHLSTVRYREMPFTSARILSHAMMVMKAALHLTEAHRVHALTRSWQPQPCGSCRCADCRPLPLPCTGSLACTSHMHLFRLGHVWAQCTLLFLFLGLSLLGLPLVSCCHASCEGGPSDPGESQALSRRTLNVEVHLTRAVCRSRCACHPTQTLGCFFGSCFPPPPHVHGSGVPCCMRSATQHSAWEAHSA